MAISTSPLPADAEAAFLSGLPAFLSGGPPGASEISVGPPPAIPSVADVGLSVTAALESFSLTLQQVANHSGAFSPSPAGWILFAGNAQGKAVLGRVVRRRHAWRLVAVNYGELVSETLRAIQTLTGSPPPGPFAANPFELRLVGIPGLNLELFWLASQSGTANFLLATPGRLPSRFDFQTNAPREVGNVLPELAKAAGILSNMGAKAGA